MRRKTHTFMLAFALVASLVWPCHAPARLRRQQTPRRVVSLLLTNGKVFTSDARGTMAEAVAIDGGRIVAVGTSAEITSRFIPARTIDLRGRLVTPGFNDAHIHFLSGGLSLMRVDLVGAKTLAESKRRVAARVREVAPGAWVTGRGWDHTLWGGGWPTRKDLDEVAPNNPVFLQRVDGHVSWANTLALQKAGVTRATRDPEGGEILRDAAGEPTGILKETAAGLVGRVVPPPTREENKEALTRALAEARRHGLTSIQDNSGYETTKLYRELLREGKLTVRVAEWQNFEDTVEELKRQRAEFQGFKDDPLVLRLTALKGYVDGTLGSRTAAMLAPFADDPGNSGIPRRTPEELTKMIVERHAAGFQIALHAIGDRANRMALAGFAAAMGQPLVQAAALGGHLELSKVSVENRGPATGRMRPATPTRHRIEHAQVVAPSDFSRFRDLGVIASMQPSHAISDKRWAQDRLGEYRVLGAYAWHAMKSFGVRMPFGTDWPVEPISPYLGLYAAVTRQSVEGDPPGGWWPQERLSMADAIRHYTAEPAYASFEENEKGQIAPGMLADLAVHSRDLLTINPAEILRTETDITVFNGRVIYERGVIEANQNSPQPPPPARPTATTPLRAVAGNVLDSAAMPPVRITVDRNLKYAGGHAFTLYDTARAEQHLFVEADGPRIKRLLMVQFEGVLPGVTHAYKYAETNPVTLGGHTYFREAAAANLATLRRDPNSDAARALAFLRGKGFDTNAEVVFQRFVRVIDEAGRNEIILIYAENLDGTGHNAAALLAPEAAPLREQVFRELSQRALRSFTLADR